MTRLRWWRRPEIVCQQWVEVVTDYLEGALPPKLQQAADGHLADCPIAASTSSRCASPSG